MARAPGSAGGGDFGSTDSGGGDSGGGDSGGGGGDAIGFGARRGGVARPIGLSPTIDRQGSGWFRGEKWPPSDVADELVKPQSQVVRFSHRSWTNYYFAIAMLARFVQVEAKKENGISYTKKAGASYTWKDVDLNPILPKEEDIEGELKDLADLIEFRAGVMSEALAQQSILARYWQALLMFNGGSHPATSCLLEVALRISQFQAMHYKLHFSRPRPSQLSPALVPPIDVPGHASFPSGHATEAYLQAACLCHVMTMTETHGPGQPETNEKPVMAPAALAAIDRMADRIARNREVLGLHYRSDSEAGKELAKRTLPLMLACDPILRLMKTAAGEWRSLTRRLPPEKGGTLLARKRKIRKKEGVQQ